MSILEADTKMSLMGKIVLKGPPVPANSIILCRMCRAPVYYSVCNFNSMEVFMPDFQWTRCIDKFCLIAPGPLHRHNRRNLCPECFHEVFAYGTLIMFFVPFPGTISLMQALHSIWRI
ncbi:hypothetical protein LCGC14_0516650 [marine sediment metagenome]|uniref:Uncharacterized protein n=1 Tax=marine sediment metagenome TaxID=412755 RepID=A0A0F9SI69_9ZZZZ